MAAVTFESFDSTPYQQVPRLALDHALELARELLGAKPAGSTEVDRMADELQELVTAIETAQAEQKQAAIPVDYTAGVELDGVTDALWAALRSRLETWSAFRHPGLTDVMEAIPKSDAARKTLGLAQHSAGRARSLARRLFGPDGLEFTRTTFAEQAQAMAKILRRIDDEGLAADLDELAGREILAGLRACQRQYEAMVEGRMAHGERKSAELSRLRGKLQRAIARYGGAVLLLLDEDDPESLSRVMQALRPVDESRARGDGDSDEL